MVSGPAKCTEQGIAEGILFSAINDYNVKRKVNQIEVSALIEVKPLDSFEKSVVYMEKAGIYPLGTVETEEEERGE